MYNFTQVSSHSVTGTRHGRPHHGAADLEGLFLLTSVLHGYNSSREPSTFLPSSSVDRDESSFPAHFERASAEIVDTEGEDVEELEMPRFNEMSLVKTVVLSAMFVVSLIGNVATLVRMYRIRRRRSTINFLVVQLATADLIVTFFCNVTDAIWSSVIQWYAGNAMCKGVKYLQVFGLYLSTYIVVVISIDRCLAIVDPISKNKAPIRVKVMIVITWLLSALFSLPQTYIFRVLRGPFKEEFHQCVTFGAYTANWQEQLYSSLTVLFMYVIPLVTMVTAYMLIFCTIAKKSRDFQPDTNFIVGNETSLGMLDMTSRSPMVRSRLFCKAKVKSLRMTALIVIAFIICWTPYQVIFIIYTFIDTSQIESRYVLWIFFFGMANSMINPLIYGAFHVCSHKQPTMIRQPLERRVQSHVSSSTSSSTSKVVRHYLSKLRMRTTSPVMKNQAVYNTSYPMAMLIGSRQNVS